MQLSWNVKRAGLMAGVWCVLGGACAVAQQKPVPPPAPSPTTTPDDAGPATGSGSIDLPKKKEPTEIAPAAPAEEKVKNPDGEIFSMRVDVPIVNLNVNVILDKNHQFVPGLKAENFLVLEDGVDQTVQTIRMTKTPITAVMLLEFAANSYAFIHDMQLSSDTFFRSLQPDDYIGVITYDLRTHILTDFTNNKDLVRQAIQSLMIPGFSDTNEFDALYETIDRLSRVEGQQVHPADFSSGVRYDVEADAGPDAGEGEEPRQNITIFSISDRRHDARACR